jgi:Tol biopolymer transport system component
MLAYRAYDDNGIQQIFTISPTGNQLAQATHHNADVQSSARWHPDGKRFFYVWNNGIIMKEVGKEQYKILTKPTSDPPADLVVSHDGNTLAFNRMVPDASGVHTKQIFIIRIN